MIIKDLTITLQDSLFSHMYIDILPNLIYSCWKSIYKSIPRHPRHAPTQFNR